MKGGLFLAAGAIAYRLGATDLAALHGLGRRMPFTMAAVVIGGLGLVGVPITSGFVSKWYLVQGAFEAGLWPVALFVLVGSLIALAYVGRVVEAAYFHPPPPESEPVREAPVGDAALDLGDDRGLALLRAPHGSHRRHRGASGGGAAGRPMSHAAQILAALAVPLAGALLISATARRPALQEAVSVVTAVALFGLVVSLAPAVVAGETPRVALFDIVPGLPIAFALEPLGMLFALIASFLWIATTVYSIGYVRANKESHQTRYYVCFAVALGSTIGIAFAGNMFTLFLFYEALTLSTYPLVTHSGTEEARRAGRTYLGILLSTSILLQLFAILWTWVEVGTLDFEKGGILAGAVSERTAAVLLVLYMFGIGKAALMPLSRLAAGGRWWRRRR